MSITKTLNMLAKNSKLRKNEIVLVTLSVLYLIFNIKLPDSVSSLVDNAVGNTVVILATLSLFYTKNPIIIVVGVMVGYELIRRSSVHTGTYAMRHELPNEESKAVEMQQYNAETNTLEEDTVENMKPIVSEEEMVTPSFKPTATKNHRAACVSSKTTL